MKSRITPTGAQRRTRPAMARAAAVAALLGAAIATVGLSACTQQRPQARPIAISGFLFKPDTLVVAQGDTLVWQNDDIVPHTSTASDSSWDSGSMAPGGSYRFVVRTPGSYPYLCTFHPNMVGMIEVH